MACGQVGRRDSAPDVSCEAPGGCGSNPWPTRPLARDSANLIAFVQQRLGAGGDVELDWALAVLLDMMGGA